MNGYFELSKASNGEFMFLLKAGNHEVILTSETYKNRGGAENGIASVAKNCADDSNYERKTAVNGKEYFLLKAANHQIIGTSQMYSSAAARDKGIESVKTNGASTEIKDATEIA